MSEKSDSQELSLTDNELLELVRNHGFDRRTVLRALGVGTALTLAGGSAAAADSEPDGAAEGEATTPVIDPHYGYSVPAGEEVPEELQPDHTVELRTNLDGEIPFYFSPMGYHIDVGDVVRFDFVTTEHTVTAYHGGQGRQHRVPDGVPPFSSPMIGRGGSWLYQFDTPGLYDLFSAPHEAFGMVMRLVVGDPDDSLYDGVHGSPSAPDRRPPIAEGYIAALTGTTPPYRFPTASEVLSTDALTEVNIVATGPVSVADVAAGLDPSDR